MADQLEYKGPFEVSMSEKPELETVHDCNKPQGEPEPGESLAALVDEEWGLGHLGRSTVSQGDEEKRRIRDARNRNRESGSHSVL